MLYLVVIIIFTIFNFTYSLAEKVYVVERERGGLSVIEDKRHVGEIKGIGNTNHAIVKFYRDSAYVITRDGYISKIEPVSNRLLKKVKVGESSIGLDFCKDFIAVANYDPGDVVILDLDLNILKKIKTDSRNVGIKARDRFLIFSLMDKEEIWILDSQKDFETYKVFKNVGNMPFDALVTGDIYIVGLFKEGSLGILDLARMDYIKKELTKGEGEVTFKIPHFGTWGILGKTAFIPAVGERRLYVIDLEDLSYRGHIDLIGLPVFVIVSPDNRYILVNYSGDTEDYVTIIEASGLSILRDIKTGKRIMHMRFSGDGKRFYLSSYFENQVKILNTGEWDSVTAIDVPTPSGIFIVP